MSQRKDKQTNAKNKPQDHQGTNKIKRKRANETQMHKTTKQQNNRQRIKDDKLGQL